MLFVALFGCTQDLITNESSAEKSVVEETDKSKQTEEPNKEKSTLPTKDISETVTEGVEKYHGFVIDNILHSNHDGDIHYNVYIPESYDGTKPYALYFTLPGTRDYIFRVWHKI